MKIFKKQIPVRHILYVVLGWLHATMLCVPLYALVLNFVSESMTKDVILQNILRGFLILAPIALSWFAIKCLRRIFSYILASIGITVLTGFLFDSVLMAVVALFICFMRLYGRLHGESHSLFDHAGYAGLAVFAVPFLCSVFTDRADLIFQPVSLVFAAVYFVLASRSAASAASMITSTSTPPCRTCPHAASCASPVRFWPPQPCSVPPFCCRRCSQTTSATATLRARRPTPNTPRPSRPKHPPAAICRLTR